MKISDVFRSFFVCILISSFFVSAVGAQTTQIMPSPSPTPTAAPTPNSAEELEASNRRERQKHRPSGARLNARIAVQKSSYSIRETVMVQIGLQNDTGERLSIVNQTPWNQVKITVVGPGGVAITSHGIDFTSINGSSHMVTLEVGEIRDLSWADTTWLSLEHWGYSLTAPGKYAITVTPYVSGFMTHERGRSATAVVTITQ